MKFCFAMKGGKAHEHALLFTFCAPTFVVYVINNLQNQITSSDELYDTRWTALREHSNPPAARRRTVRPSGSCRRNRREDLVDPLLEDTYEHWFVHSHPPSRRSLTADVDCVTLPTFSRGCRFPAARHCFSRINLEKPVTMVYSEVQEVAGKVTNGPPS